MVQAIQVLRFHLLELEKVSWQISWGEATQHEFFSVLLWYFEDEQHEPDYLCQFVSIMQRWSSATVPGLVRAYPPPTCGAQLGQLEGIKLLL